MKKAVLCGVLVALMAVPALAGEAAKEKPKVEVVFVLDTTGSMSGLIKAAKAKVWAIANTLATAKPAPDIKMGLVGYRDRADKYVTKRTELTTDLDAIYTHLMAFQAQGGGDTPESVNQALNEAVTKMKWSTDDKTYRVIFLVGDSPPHMDYKDDVKYSVTCELAARNGIMINTIQCGTRTTTTPIWTDIAKRAEGQYFRVEQSGGAILAATPFDAKLTELSKKLEATRVYYGSAEVRGQAKKRAGLAKVFYAKSAPSATATRAVFNAGEAGRHNFAGKDELVQAVADKRVKLEDLKDDELPGDLRKMKPEERKKFVEQQLATRAKLQKEIQALSEKRQAHIKAQLAKSKLKPKASLDHKLYDAIKGQAGKKGIEYKSGPSY